MKNVSSEFGFDAGEICETVFGTTSHAMLVTDCDNTIRMCNPGFERMSGFVRKELIRNKLQELFPGQHRLVQALNVPELQQEENEQSTITTKHGIVLDVDVKLYAHMHSTEGHVVIFLFTDISKQKRLENDLRAEREQQKLLIEHTPAAVAMFDVNMRYISVSRRWHTDFNIAENDIIGKSHYDVFPEITDELKSYHGRGLQGESFTGTESEFARNDGSVDWVKWELCPWYSASGTIGGIIIFSEVVTKRKQAEEAVLKMNEELERKVKERTQELTDALDIQKRTNELKSRFVTTASHEFRTPLGALLSSSYILEQYFHPVQGSKEAKHFSRIRASVGHLTEILNDFLSLDKLENGAIKPGASRFDIADLAHDIVAEFDGTLKKGQTIRIEISGPTSVNQDKNILRNILYNLLSNAIKFSLENQEIEFSIKTQAEKMEICVTDHGIGIPEDEHDLMFTRLFRARNAINIPGTGVGLNIVNKYVELIGGHLTFTSKIGEGTTFTVVCPVTI